MTGRRGSVTVVEVQSGRLLATYNLNGAARRVARPGSAIKPFVLLALLSNDKISAEERLACRRRLNLAGHKLDCGHPDMGEPLNAVSALAYSCNDYFTSMAVRLTPAQLRQALLQAGLASRPGIAPHEAAGEVVLSSTRESLQLQSIGEQNVRTTPLALLAAYRKLALRRREGIADAPLLTVLAGLDAAIDYGMARLAQPAGAMKVAGKTGTSLADGGQWTHGWFVGFAPAARPEIAVVVFLERGTGPTGAAPIARLIFEAYSGGRH